VASDDRTHGLGPTRARVLALLQDVPAPLAAVEIAERLGVHPNSARFHLDALEAAGLVERRSPARRGPGRPKVLYAARPAAPDVTDRRYRLLAEMLVDVAAAGTASPAQAGEAVGRRWAAQLPLRARDRPEAAEPAAGVAPEERPDEGGQDTRHAVSEPDGLTTLVSTLGGVGFDSHVVDDEEGVRVEISHCPFLEVAEKHPVVVCSLHLGLMRGVLERAGAPVGVRDLHPLVEPSLCRAPLIR
jgi:predicted ArsR family transcriptional regulator